MRENLIRIKDVMKRTGLAKSTIYKYMKKGIFPKQIKSGTRFAAWVESEIEA
ncbi:helix-turn-helix transcriptional regulator [Halomonas korlensis]|uniref:Transcriptional regulator, AlpA family n=1 Tax=Halomonas korlensis TaxID=463301 RepID=A0A1I7GKQ8_9GAMM|nr:AlpA family phage regulatory protein [Halomonas korlensis]SFU49009.1 transcriptional regulator, AlpA family [Halomonas korlensis]